MSNIVPFNFDGQPIRVAEKYAHKLALDLECVLADAEERHSRMCLEWAKAIEDAAIEYADAYVEMQCDADNDHQREHREALRNLRETIRRGLECVASPQPAAQPEQSLCGHCGRQVLGEAWPVRALAHQTERKPMTDDQAKKGGAA